METGIISFNVKVGRWWNIQIHLNLCLILVDSGGHRNVPRPRWSSWPRTNCSSSNEASCSFILPGTSAQDGEETYSNSQDIPKYWKSAGISVLRSQQRPLSCFGVTVKLLVLGRKLRRRTLKLTGLPQVLQKHHLKTQNTAAQCPPTLNNRKSPKSWETKQLHSWQNDRILFGETLYFVLGVGRKTYIAETHYELFGYGGWQFWHPLLVQV